MSIHGVEVDEEDAAVAGVGCDGCGREGLGRTAAAEVQDVERDDGGEQHDKGDDAAPFAAAFFLFAR